MQARDGSEFDSKVVVEEGEHEGGSSDEDYNEGGHKDDPWWLDYDESGPYDARQHERQGHCSDSLMEKEGKSSRRKNNISGMRLYEIARGKGGSMATGLYRDTWDISQRGIVRGENNGKGKIGSFFRAFLYVEQNRSSVCEKMGRLV